MNTNTHSSPYDWLKEIPTALLQMDSIPLLGHPPPFPWEEFSKKLAAILQVNLKAQPTDLQWRASEDLLTGLGGKPYPIHIAIPGIEGDLCWVFSERDIHLLMALLISKQKEPLDIIDPDFEKGFVHFLIYEVFQVFSETNLDKTLTPHLAEKEGFPTEASLCQDVAFAIDDSEFVGRLIISQQFRNSWKEKYAVRTLDVPLNKELAEKIQLPVHLEAGRTALPLAEWKKVQLGDFLLLEQCAIDPKKNLGGVMLTLNGIPYFRAELKDGKIKLIERPLYQEVENTMAKESPDKGQQPKPKEEEHEDFELEHTEDEQYDFDEISIDEEVEAHKEAAAPDQKPAAAPAPGAAPAAAAPKAAPQPAAAPAAKAPPAQPKKAPEEKALAPDQIPLSIVIEVGRLQMSIQKIMDLQPGNMLELDIRPENGVDLVVNGRRIGKGELIRLGEVLGVRILDIG